MGRVMPMCGLFEDRSPGKRSFIGFKQLCCPESWMKHTIATFRWKMVQVAGRIVRHAGETVLKFAIDIKRLNEALFYEGILE